MNYAEAREIPGKGWHWTTMNNGSVRTAQPCIRHIGDESDPMWYLKPWNAADWQRCLPHKTKEDAERHFYEWSLANVKEGSWDAYRKCHAPGCEVLTNKTLSNRGFDGYFQFMDELCDEHRTREVLAVLHPFMPEIALMHS